MNKSQKIHDKEKVKLRCIDCGIGFEMSRGRYRRIKDASYRCKECRKIIVREKSKEAWANKSEEELKTFSQKISNYWTDKNRQKKSKQMSDFVNSLSEDDKKNWTKNINKLSEESKIKKSESLSKMWKNRSEEENTEIRKKMSDSRKKLFDSLSNEEREELFKTFSLNIQRYWESLTEEKYDEHCQKISDARNNISQEEKDKRRQFKIERYNNLSDEEKEKYKTGIQNYWNNMTPEEYERHCQKIVDGMNSLSEEAKTNRLNKMTKASKDWWNNKSDKEKFDQIVTMLGGDIEEYENYIGRESEYYSIISKNKWDSQSLKEFQNSKLYTASNFNKIEMKDIKPSKTELELIETLQLEGFNYTFQFYNIEKHPDWDKLFTINSINKSNFVSPYHCWDFLIKTKKKNILVDIDGSVHRKNNMLFKLPGQDFTIRELIDFNDSQRPYQTDGLEAYVIKCYDDTLTDDTEVVSVNDDSMKLTFKQFISMLLLLNK